jgi:hypothetical protein
MRRLPEHEPRHNQDRLPAWAQRERFIDLAWIYENLHIFRPLAQAQFHTHGRGALVVDTTSRPKPDAGHPLFYLPQEVIETFDEPDVQQMVTSYKPSREMVIVLIKQYGRQSSYCIITNAGYPRSWDMSHEQVQLVPS